MLIFDFVCFVGWKTVDGSIFTEKLAVKFVPASRLATSVFDYFSFSSECSFRFDSDSVLFTRFELKV